MRKAVAIMVAWVVAFLGVGCVTVPQPKDEPNYEQVRQDHRGAQGDLQNEESRRQER